MKIIRLFCPAVIVLFIINSISITYAVEQNNTGMIFSRRYLEQKMQEAKAGKLDYEFAALLFQTANNDFLKAVKNPHADGRWDSALEKYEFVLKLYEAGKAEPIYIVAAANQLGVVYFHRLRLKTAESLFNLSLAIVEEYKLDFNTEIVKQQYLLSLTFLGRIYRRKGQTKLARETLSKALSFAARHFGKDSAQVKATRSHMEWFKSVD